MSSNVLSRDGISTNDQWIATGVGVMPLSTYRELAASRARKPHGLAVVAARRAFTRDLPLPPGGVLLGIDAIVGEDWRLDESSYFRCSVAERRDSKGRLVLTINTELRPSVGAAGAAEVANVRFALLWPEKAAEDA